MSTRRDDYRTYPGDRPTRHTPAQRAGKVARAAALLAEAEALLVDLCDDFTANSYRLPHALGEEWRNAAAAADTTRTARRQLLGE